jgi:hypothetical protein
MFLCPVFKLGGRDTGVLALFGLTWIPASGALSLRLFIAMFTQTKNKKLYTVTRNILKDMFHIVSLNAPHSLPLIRAPTTFCRSKKEKPYLIDLLSLNEEQTKKSKYFYLKNNNLITLQ